MKADVGVMPLPTDEPSPDATSPACQCDGRALELVASTPRVGPYPELKTFRCTGCGAVVTIESD